MQLFHIFKRLLIAKEFGDRSAERRAYSNLGNAYIFLGEFETAAEYYRWVTADKHHLYLLYSLLLLCLIL